MSQFPSISASIDGDDMSDTAEYMIEVADRCNRLARVGRDMVENLEAISNELMAKAVEIDTSRQKNQKAAR